MGALADHPLTAMLVALEVVLLLVGLLVAPRDRRPTAAVAWILVLVALPGLGLLLFWLIGSPRLPRRRRDLQRTMNERIAEVARVVEHPEPGPEVPGWLAGVARLVRSFGGLPMVDGNQAEVIEGFPEQVAALAAAVDGAVREVHVEFYILALDASTEPFFAAVDRAVARGVAVRVLADHLGSRRYRGFRPARRRLAAAGVPLTLMLPVQPLRGRYQRPDLRNHRKLLVVDGAVAFIGSLNLIDPAYGHRGDLRWQDLLVRLQGPVVQEVAALFVTDWFSETGELLPTDPVAGVADDRDPATLLCQIAPSGPAFESENNAALFVSLIYAAERRLGITSPYFVPDESLLAAITTAARRGVEVELFVGAVGDQPLALHAQHSYYGTLLAAGVRIHRYPGPAILHSKHVTVDDVVTVIGSSNMDIRSFQLDFELSLLVCSRDFTDRVRRIEDGYRRVSSELTGAEWSGRSRWHRIGDDLARLTSALQ
jgi:cardiolipin synthase